MQPGRLALYAGGFLGPFGGGVIGVLIPPLREAFGASTALVTAGITVYLVPFAALQLVSGTLGERWGLGRTVRTAYLAYAVVSVAAAFAPGIEVFLACRALQGVANAFLTPLLLAALAESTPPERVGRSVGTFAAVQTAALVAAPLGGGLAGELTWRAAFLAPAVSALALALLPLPGARRRVGAPPRLRAALTPRVGWLSAAAFLGYLSLTGLGFLVALRAAEEFGLSSSATGLLVAGFGLAGMLAGRPAGGLVDRGSRVGVAAVGAVGSGLALALVGLAGSPGLMALAWLATGAGSALVWAGINTMAVEAVPANRAGATSIVSAVKFAGNAAGPALWLPLYAAGAATTFLVAGAMTMAIAAALVPLREGRKEAPTGIEPV